MKLLLFLLLFIFSYGFDSNDSFIYKVEKTPSFLSNTNISYSGYTNLYAINRINDGSVIKLPFRLFSLDLNIDYMNFSINAKWGLEHKIKSFNTRQPFPDLAYDLVSPDNVDYKSDFREFYLSYFPPFGEIKLGKQIHAWGATDVSSPIDILNSIDYYYLFTDTDETKIGRNSLVMNLYLEPIKIELLIMPNHIPNNIPNNDPDFPITLPTSVQDYQFLDMDNPIEYGAYIQNSMNNMDWTFYYFSGYDRNFNLYGANIFSDEFDVNTVTDTVFSYRKTEMYALSNVSFIGEATLRADLAYFNTDAGSQSISDRAYYGQDPISNFLDFSNNIASSYFNISGKYYQYNIQLEYPLPFDIEFTSQIFGYEKMNIKGDVVDVALTNFEIYLDGKDFFYPGMGSSMATLAKNGLLINLTKTIWDDTMEFQLTNLLDTQDNGQLTQFKLTYSIIEDLNFSLLYYKGRGNQSKYADDPNTENIDESLLYPFNAMEGFSHIRAQLQYFF